MLGEISIVIERKRERERERRSMHLEVCNFSLDDLIYFLNWDDNNSS